MPSVVKVKDYFENDYNGLWSWYLSNLRDGHFEELTNNVLKFTLLKRFLNEHLMQDIVQFNKKMLLVSIPDNIHQDITILENFLRSYFHLDDLQYIQIKKLTDSQIYNHENHYLISDNLNNFHDRSFLGFGQKKHDNVRPQLSYNGYSVLSGETGYASLRTTEEQNGTHRPSGVVEQCNGNSPATPRDVTAVEPVKSSEDEEDQESGEIVLNFPHKPPKNIINQREQEVVTTSEDVSINSEDASSYDGEALIQTITRDEDASSADEDNSNISELSSVDHSLNSLSYNSDISSDDYSMASIFPAISISDTFGTFRLVLQSILIQNPDTREIFTAVRQSNNDPNVAHINDDWLLYDEKFSMHNLQMLSLHDVLEINRFFPKILFYTMVMLDTEEIADEAHAYIPNDPHLPPPSQGIASTSTLSQNTLRLLPTATSNVTYTRHNELLNAAATSAQDAENYFPEDNHDDEDDQEVNGVMPLYAPTRTNSNSTTAHRSILTVNSIGEWAFHHNEPYPQNNHSNISFADQNTSTAGKMKRVSSKGSSKNTLQKTTTVGSLSAVERSKSTPLPTLLRTLSGLDDETMMWKRKVEKFKRKRRAKKEGKKLDNNCVVM